MPEVSELAQDLLRGTAEISTYTGEPERRVRLLIADHGMPVFRRGKFFYSRKSWLDRWYFGEEVAANGVGEKS